jgi:hypothetical protein
VDEILDHLDIVFRDYFEKDKAVDQYARITQQPGDNRYDHVVYFESWIL